MFAMYPAGITGLPMLQVCHKSDLGESLLQQYANTCCMNAVCVTCRLSLHSSCKLEVFFLSQSSLQVVLYGRISSVKPTEPCCCIGPEDEQNAKRPASAGSRHTSRA